MSQIKSFSIHELKFAGKIIDQIGTNNKYIDYNRNFNFYLIVKKMKNMSNDEVILLNTFNKLNFEISALYAEFNNKVQEFIDIIYTENNVDFIRKKFLEIISGKEDVSISWELEIPVKENPHTLTICNFISNMKVISVMFEDINSAIKLINMIQKDNIFDTEIQIKGKSDIITFNPRCDDKIIKEKFFPNLNDNITPGIDGPYIIQMTVYKEKNNF